MSELKAFRIIQGDTGGYGAPSYKCDTDGNRIEEWSDVCEVYDRSEADKVIAEKDKEIAELLAEVEDVINTYKASVESKVKIWERCKKAEADTAEKDKEISHQKYKRCLDMVAYCDLKMSYWAIREIHEGDTGKFDLYSKWYDRWRELADKFKEAK